MPIEPRIDAPIGPSPVALPPEYEATPYTGKVLIDDFSTPEGGPYRQRRPEPPAPTWKETISAAFDTENEVVGAWKKISEDKTFGPFDPEHNPFSTIKGTELEQFAASFLGSANQAHTDAIAMRIRQELKSRKILEESGWSGMAAQMVAGLMSPTTLLPGGAIYRGAKAGQAAAKTAAVVGAANAGAAALQEAALHTQQYTRTGMESALGIGGAFILGGILGGGASGLSSKRFIEMSRALDRELNVGPRIAETIAAREGGVGSERLNDVSIGGGAGSAGAASTRLPDIQEVGAFGLERVMSFATPDARVRHATSPVAREVGAQLADTTTLVTRNLEGITTAPRGGSVETRVKTQGVALEGQAVQGVREAWAEYRFGDPKTSVPGMRAMLDRSSGKLSEKEFRVEVGKAMANNDTHDIPEVAKAAKHVRKVLIDPLAEAAIKQKLLDPEVVAKGRPKGDGGAGGTGGAPVGPGPGGGGPAADPHLRTQADDLLRRFEELSGTRFHEPNRQHVIDLLLSDNDYMRQVRAALGLDESGAVPALGDMASHQARAEFNDVVRRLDAGETVTMPPDHAAVHFEKLGPALDALPEGTKAGVISSIRPVGGGLLEVSITGRDGRVVKLPKPLPQTQLEVTRAFHEPLSGSIVFSRLYGVGGVSAEALLGELRHEQVHVIFKGLDRAVRDRLVAHAESLRVLDKETREYMAHVDVPTDVNAASAAPRTLRESYRDLYKQTYVEFKPFTNRLADIDREMKDIDEIAKHLKRGEDDELILELTDNFKSLEQEQADLSARLAKINARINARVAEEAVAHMVEMHYHGLVSDADIAPIRSDIEKMFGDVRTAADRQVEGSDVMLAIRDLQSNDWHMSQWEELANKDHLRVSTPAGGVRERKSPQDRQTAGLIASAKDLEAKLKAGGASSAAIAEQMSDAFGAPVSAAQVESGFVWWRIDDDKTNGQFQKIWTPEEIAATRELVMSGMPRREVARAMSEATGRRVSHRAVDHMMSREFGGTGSKFTPGRKWPAEVIAALKSDEFAAMSSSEAARALDERFGFKVDRSRIYRMRQKMAAGGDTVASVVEQGQPMFAISGNRVERPDATPIARQIMDAISPYLNASRAAEMAGLNVERDASGAITSVVREGKRYSITRDADGNVAGISEMPDQGARDLAVTRDANGAAVSVDDTASAQAQMQAHAAAVAAREAINQTLSQAASRMGLKGVTPERVDAVTSQIMESAQRAIADGASAEAAVLRTLQDAIDPMGHLRQRIMSAVGGDEAPHVKAGDQAAKAGDPVENLQARRLAQEIEDAARARDMSNMEAGAGGDHVFSKAIGDEVWDDGGQSYIHRMYLRPKIAAQRPQFAKIITDYFEGAQRRASGVLRRMQEEADKAQAATGKAPNAAAMKDMDDLRQFVGLSRGDLAASAEQVIRHIEGLPEGRLMFDLPAAVRGPLKARTLRIPDALIEDFLERDINVISRAYTRTMSPDIELARMFGSVDMKEPIAKIADDYTKLITAATDEKTRVKLTAERDNMIRDILAMADRQRGTYGLPADPMAWTVRAARLVKTENFVTKLGGMTIAALSDPARAMMTHGITEYFRDGVFPLMRGLKGIKAAGDELRLHGAAWDMVLSSRGHALADVMDDYGRYSKFERGVGWVQDKFSVLTLMNQWNTALKTFSGTIVMNNIIRDAIKITEGSATKRQITRMAAAGIDEADARIIAEQFSKHGGVVDGVYLPDTKKWDVANPNVRNALESFSGAIVRDVDRIIVTPGQDKPLMASTVTGQIVFQFKSFGFASMQRTLIAGLQQRDAGVLLGSVMMIGMGAVAEYLKAVTNKKELPKNNAQWVAAAVDRSGLLAWLPDINHVAEQLSGGQFGMSAFTGKELSRYAARNWADSALGPTAGMVKDLYGATSGFSRAITGKERLHESDVAALRRIIPFQNLFYLSYLFQSLEESAAKGLGAQPSTRRQIPGR